MNGASYLSSKSPDNPKFLGLQDDILVLASLGIILAPPVIRDLKHPNFSTRVKRENAMPQEDESLELKLDRLSKSNEDLYQFAYLAAHELQAPLNAVEGFLSLLKSDYSSELDEEAVILIREALSGSKRMGKIINGLLSLCRVDSQDIKFESTDSRTALDGAIKNLKPMIKESKAKIEIGNLPTLAANHTLLMLLFQNLINNAMKFCERQPHIEIVAQKEGPDWLFSVKDNGVGFDAKHINKLFQRFQRLHTAAQFPGSGLGLALCKTIVDRHKGKIWAESTSDKGSMFCFTIPELPVKS